MHKKILTLEDLYNFCFENKMYKFNAEDSGYKLCVQVPSVCTFEEKKDNESSMLFGTVRLLHTNTNNNRSNVTKEAAEKCMPGIKYKPVLANFMVDENGDKDFTSHDFEVNEDGSINYLEKQVGCFTADEPYMEYDEENDRYYVYATVAIPRVYTDAASVIERKGGTTVSCELFVNSLSVDAKKKEMILEDIEVMGVTLLGKNPDTYEEVKPGMQNARLDIADFSVTNTATYSQNDKLIETIEKLISRLDNTNSMKGGKSQVKFEELCKKYGKNVEEITFEYEGMSDEELEVAFAEAFDEQKKIVDDSAPVDEGETPEVEGEPTPQSDDEDEPEHEAPAEDTVEPAAESEDETPEAEDATQEDSATEDFEHEGQKKYSVEYAGVKKEFAVSLSDKQRALDTLVNDTYAEADCDYYFVDVYEEDKCVVMHNWSGKHYRQSFKCKKNVYSLVGDRVEVFAQYMTEDEIAQLDAMKHKFESYETAPQKEEILNKAKYNYISDTVEFVELRENHFDLSVSEVEAKANEILMSYAEQGKLNFAAVDNVVGSKKLQPQTKTIKSGRYGNTFSK